MVIFHMHKRSIRICLAIIILSPEAGRMPVIDRLAFQETAEQLQIFLVPTFPSASAVDKNSMLFFADLL